MKIISLNSQNVVSVNGEKESKVEMKEEKKTAGKTSKKDGNKTGKKSTKNIVVLSNEDIMTTKEAADFLKLEIDALYKWMEKGFVPYYKITYRKRLFSRSKLSEWLNTMEVNG